MQASFWLTSSCNLKCIYCYEGENKLRVNINTQTIDRALDLIIEYMKEIKDKYLWIVLHGGEPFLAFKEMKYLVKKAKDRAEKYQISLSFSVTSNGTLLNDEIITFIQKEIDDFPISMDGKAKTQNYSRPFADGNATFEIVEQNVRKILKVKPDLRVRMTYNQKTVKDLYENVSFFVELGVKCIVPVQDFYDKSFKYSDIQVLNKQIRKICKKYRENEVLLSNWKLIKRGNCSGGITSMHIDSFGDIYPCMLAVGNREFLIGNVYKGIDSNKQKIVLEYSECAIPECEGCDLYCYCNETRCKIINKVINGDYMKPSAVACEIERIKYRLCVDDII